jgi:hypothetical protein
MAKIVIKGTIDKVFPSRKGFSVLETTTNQKTGVEYKSWFNVFTLELDGLAIGDSVTVDGFASAGAYMGKDRSGEPEPKASISVSLPTVLKHQMAVAPTVDPDLF